MPISETSGCDDDAIPCMATSGERRELKGAISAAADGEPSTGGAHTAAWTACRRRSEPAREAICPLSTRAKTQVGTLYLRSRARVAARGPRFFNAKVWLELHVRATQRPGRSPHPAGRLAGRRRLARERRIEASELYSAQIDASVCRLPGGGWDPAGLWTRR